ncbi:MAG: hypothetical protein AB1298_03195 [Bacteroidota bacterium]
MKNIISLVVLMSSTIFAQTIDTIPIHLSGKSLIELKQLSAINIQHPASSIQHPASSIQYPASSIQYPVSSISRKDKHYPELTIQDFSSEKKNPALGILYSLLLPGMGELYANRYDNGKYFTIADAVLWGVFAGFNIYGNWQENNYKSFAQSNGAVKLDGKNADYFANIGIYQSIDDYNTAMELDRRFEKVYSSSTYYWKWTDDNQRKEYRSMWLSSEQAFTNVRFVVGALILNRLISAINAVRMVSAYNKNLSLETSWNISVGVENNSSLPPSLTFSFVKAF